MEMNVWLVAGFWDYEGMMNGSLRVFRSRDAADAYAAELRVEEDSLDYVEVWEEEVR